ncbi:hypothetical protein PF005_g3459 [Phytophthora fragariae]|uniref:Uncharacterized protein n=1 Tax=Phytophthora fragariae TaxID=53985 RepID=A0A6A3T9H0_9STRA|nr:hypothetical protein PF009_g4019 [Phytophthora fragariae]KAE9025610.1 hypothetical protein PF011_g2957 [Phytophthora fragariae]KAE9131983.1 hypothetical protein PF010_g3361 [Phytophthora fragariae]KAE9132511.1 hypothetical protein PF007_g3698 [Phytophthora fragariae]KAE9153111.1 hypothetical protein PF006_g2732 [Phytophthora fragariae]
MAANGVFNDLNLVLQLNQHVQGVALTPDGARLRTPTTALARQTSFKVLTDLESVSYSTPREDAQFDHQRSVFLSVSSSDLPFHLQGDRDFNEASAMAKRRALRFSESVKSRIAFVWEVAGGKKQAETAQHLRKQQLDESKQGRGQQSVRRVGAANDVKSLLPPLHELDEEDYMALMLLIFKVLRDDFVLELAHKQIQCDWEVDSHHGQTLSFDQFFAAVFEIVDVWTCDVEEATYERFLHLLARRITRRVVVFLDGAELKLALSDNFEPEVVVKSIPLRTIPRFASVAHVVANTGISTVGELARADPKVVERERIDFIQRKNGGAVSEGLSEARKIGQDLQTLLAMFRSIALQFENINYALDNNVLRRLPSAVGPRPQPSENVVKSGEGVGGADQEKRRIGRFPGSGAEVSASNPAKNGALSAPGVDGTKNLSGKGGGECQGITAGSSNSAVFGNDISRSGVIARDSNLVAAHNLGNTRNASMIDGKVEVGNPHVNTRTRGTTESSSSYIQPPNTIHDLQFADAGVMNALRSTFLIEKAISIERQTELPAIRNELLKFGVDVDATKRSDDAVRDRYNALYDLLVLRDGESLKTLAAIMLEQIKFELGVHGIIVDDEEDVEEVYDGFYASVVTGTGESIVQDAQRWMEGAIRGDRVNDYIQHDFHELKSVDEVKLLGTQQGDEEFLSLLAKDTDVEDEVAEVVNKSPGKKNSSPIQRKPSRVVAVHIPTVETCHENESRPPGPVEESLPHAPPEPVPTPVKDEVDHDVGEKTNKSKKKKHLDKASHHPVKISSPVETEHSGHSSRSHQVKVPALSNKPKPKPKLTISIQDSTGRGVDVSENKVVDEGSSLGPTIETADASTPDDTKRNRPTLLTSRHGRPDSGLEIDPSLGDVDHHDISDEHTTRDALNIAIEFEDDNIEAGPTGARVDGERSISMEPKVPKIVVGGSPSATNVPVTGRYIQLLGLGTVLITKIEHDLFQLLRSHEGLDTDLVCFDIGTELDTALAKLQLIQRLVGNRVVLFGGNTDEPGKTQQVALECLAQGALYFATIPFDFPRLREKIMSFFENSKQPYVLRQRKPPGQAAQVGSSIGSGSLFALHDQPRKASTSVALAKTPRRKLAVAIPPLPSLSRSPRETFQSTQGLSESRRADFTPIAPTTPRSSQSKTRSPRFSTAMNKLIR